MKSFVSTVGLVALMALAACAPKAEKSVAAIDPRTSATATPVRLAEPRTLDDMLAHARERFAAADRNQDGKVTTEELEQARADRDVSGPRWGAGGRLMRADTDTDGKITQADVEAHARDRFIRLDADKNGIVTGAEMRAGLRPPDN
ncbi:hypothetical protein [Phenylobacterium sp.]|uniref:hypothetical protein n=1 Tax=Phenylobacterium sp. TaxID=1871053 RepID=UPI0030F42FBE